LPTWDFDDATFDGSASQNSLTCRDVALLSELPHVKGSTSHRRSNTGRPHDQLLAFPSEMRGALFSILRMPSDVIGKIYASGRLRGLSELLMNLEDDRCARAVVLCLVAELKRSMGGTPKARTVYMNQQIDEQGELDA
jgi:hypothetical protein